MQLHLSMRDGVPIYRQIVNQVKFQVASGRLGAGDELPPIRVLAERLVINPNTVSRAYAELEHEGLVVKRHGTGTFIAEVGSPLRGAERRKILVERVDGLLAEAAHLGVDVGEVVEVVRERAGQMLRGSTEGKEKA